MQVAAKRRERKGRYFQGYFKPKNPEKYSGDPTNIIYRSSWELKLMMWLDNHPDVIKYASEEIQIPYRSPIDGRWHRYFPDFLVKMRDKSGKPKTILIEVKPEKQTIAPAPKKATTKSYLTEVMNWGVNSAKWEAAREYCKDRGWEFMVMTEKHLNIRV